MNKKQEKIHKKLQQRFQENLTCFAKNHPQVYQALATLKPSKYKLEVTKSGLLNIISSSGHLYPGDAKIFSTHQAKNFLEKPVKIMTGPKLSASEELIRKRLTARHQDKIIRLSPKSSEQFKDYYFDKVNIHILLLCGVGLGYHLDYLLKKTNIRNLIIYESDIELFYFSLYTLNWDEILSSFSQDNYRSINLVFGADTTIAEESISRSLKSLAPILVNTFVYEHIVNKFYETTIKNITSNWYSCFAGLGSYDDEMNGTRQFVQNIKDGRQMLKNGDAVSNRISAFVIGSGPSLDEALPLIKKNRHNAIIFSCGTALRALVNANIIPDYHIELERNEAAIKLISDIDNEILNKITLLGLNVVKPEIFNLFKKSGMLARSKRTPDDMLDKDIVRFYNPGPTATNLGLNVALYLGFSQIYLYGVDFGFADKDKHHSSGTAYYDNTSNTKISIPEHYDHLYELDGNLGGKFYSHRIWVWAKEMMENSVKYFKETNKQLEVFNFGQGAKINYTKPLDIVQLSLNDVPEELPSQTLTLIQHRIDSHSNLREKMPVILHEILTELQNYALLLDNSVKQKFTSREDIIDFIVKEVWDSTNMITMGSSASSLLVGSIKQLLDDIYRMVMAEYDDNKSVALGVEAIKLYNAFIKDVVQDFNTYIENLHLENNSQAEELVALK